MVGLLYLFLSLDGRGRFYECKCDISVGKRVLIFVLPISMAVGRIRSESLFGAADGAMGMDGLESDLAVPKFWDRIVMITLCNEASNIELWDNTIVAASIAAENM